MNVKERENEWKKEKTERGCAQKEKMLDRKYIKLLNDKR